MKRLWSAIRVGAQQSLTRFLNEVTFAKHAVTAGVSTGHEVFQDALRLAPRLTDAFQDADGDWRLFLLMVAPSLPRLWRICTGAARTCRLIWSAYKQQKDGFPSGKSEKPSDC